MTEGAFCQEACPMVIFVVSLSIAKAQVCIGVIKGRN